MARLTINRDAPRQHLNTSNDWTDFGVFDVMNHLGHAQARVSSSANTKTRGQSFGYVKAPLKILLAP